MVETLTPTEVLAPILISELQEHEIRWHSRGDREVYVVFHMYAILLLLSRSGGSKGGRIPFRDSSKIRVWIQPSQQPCLDDS